MLKIKNRSARCSCSRSAPCAWRVPAHAVFNRPSHLNRNSVSVPGTRRSAVTRATNSSGVVQPQPEDQGPGAAQQQQDSAIQTVPWGLARIFQVIALWLTAFYTVGTLLVPILLEVLNINQGDLGPTGQAVLYLVTDLGQMVSALMVLRWCAHQHHNYKLQDLLPLNLNQLRSWLPLLLLSCLTFPCIDFIAYKVSALVAIDVDVWPGPVESNMFDGNWAALGASMVTTLICAPIWEEAIFRGFLLTSLANLMPPLPSTLVSSLLFALFHFKPLGYVPLFLLGVLFSINYLRARTLLAPIILHSLWNLYLWLAMALRPYWWALPPL